MPSVSTVNPDVPVLLVQLSDSHLFAEAGGTLLGMNTRDSLQRVIDLVLAQQPQIDLLLATGDLSQDGTLESYQQFRDLSQQIGAPARWIPGNHDEPQVMAQATMGSALLESVVDVGNWRITLLDSAVPGSVPGYLAEPQLQLLAQALSEAPGRHHLRRRPRRDLAAPRHGSRSRAHRGEGAAAHDGRRFRLVLLRVQAGPRARGPHRADQPPEDQRLLDGQRR